jgi:signal transduction histidine kinase
MILDPWNNFKKSLGDITKPHKNPRLKRYLFPILFLILLTLLKVHLYGYLSKGNTFFLFTFGIILSSWYGGFGPGILFTIISTIALNFFIRPILTPDTNVNLANTIIYVIQGLLISVIAEAKAQADEQKDDFIGYAAHEIKNPIAAIKGYASILKRKYSDTEITSISNKINSYSNTVADIINDLLDMTKIESGKIDFHDEEFDVYELIKDIIAGQRIITKSHKILLEKGSHVKIKADRIRIGQVITNLISNAIKYSPDGDKVIVKIDLHHRNITVSIQDFGIGIPTEQQNKVFQRFYRSSNAHHANGLGIGLYIARTIINHYKGQLWLKSKIDRGTTFFIQLPVNSP